MITTIGALINFDSEVRSNGEQLPRAELHSPRGVASALKNTSGPRRVRILLKAQPLLQAAQRPQVNQLIESSDTDRLKPYAQRSPSRIKSEEKVAAVSHERNYEEAVDLLGPAADRTLAELESVRETVKDAGGRPLETEIAPAALIAKVPPESMQRLAARRNVQALTPATRERPLLNFATPSTGVPAWWAAGHLGGQGRADSVSVDVGTDGEASEPSHPAFAGVDVDDVGGGVSHHGTHVGGVIASQDGSHKGAAPGIDTLLGGVEPRLLGFADTTGPGAPDPAEGINLSFGSFESDDDDDSP